MSEVLVFQNFEDNTQISENCDGIAIGAFEEGGI
jgi:hypothetical protein